MGASPGVRPARRRPGTNGHRAEASAARIDGFRPECLGATVVRTASAEGDFPVLGTKRAALRDPLDPASSRGTLVSEMPVNGYIWRRLFVLARSTWEMSGKAESCNRR